MAFHGNAANANVTTDVSQGTYGSGNAIPVITIDSSGRLDAINTSSVTYSTLNAGATVGSVGSYAFMQQASGNTQYAPGDTLAGSSLRYSDATGRVQVQLVDQQLVTLLYQVVMFKVTLQELYQVMFKVMPHLLQVMFKVTRTSTFLVIYKVVKVDPSTSHHL